jgi:hypothetical protein
MVLRFAAPAPIDRMRIVKADQPLAIGPMQCERVVDAVWFLRRHRHSRHDKADPMAARWIDHENLPSSSSSISRLGSRWSATCSSYHTEATNSTRAAFAHRS